MTEEKREGKKYSESERRYGDEPREKGKIERGKKLGETRQKI